MGVCWKSSYYIGEESDSEPDFSDMEDEEKTNTVSLRMENALLPSQRRRRQKNPYRSAPYVLGLIFIFLAFCLMTGLWLHCHLTKDKVAGMDAFIHCIVMFIIKTCNFLIIPAPCNG